VARLNKKQKLERALKDLGEIGVMDDVKRILADRCLTCPPGDVGTYRNQAALCDQFMATIRQLATMGKLNYDE